jgi:hypothetical protein
MAAARQKAAFHIGFKAHALLEMITQHVYALAGTRRKANK